MVNGQTNPMRTLKGIAAAKEARRLHYANRPEVGAPQVFIVRLAVDHRFGWEIRRFGNIVLSRSFETYGSPMLAKTAGERALVDTAAQAQLPPASAPAPLHQSASSSPEVRRV